MYERIEKWKKALHYAKHRENKIFKWSNIQEASG